MNYFICNLFFLFLFIFISCHKTFAYIEKKQSNYDPEVFEHVLNYCNSEGNYKICIEEEFEIAEGEIVDFKTENKLDEIDFILNTDTKVYYVLKLNLNGKMVLYTKKYS